MRLHQSSIKRSKHVTDSSAGVRKKRRKLQVPILYRIYLLLTSPAGALLMGILGYYVFSGISNAFAPESQVASVLIWGLLLIIAFLAFREGRQNYIRKLYIYFVPAVIFITFYTFRVLENVYNLEMQLDPSPLIMLSILTGGAIFPAFLYAAIAGGIRDDHFIKAILFLCLFFLISAGLNFNELTESLDGRMQLQKVNPIALAYTAVWLIVGLTFYLKRSWAVTAMAVICIPILAFVVIYAKSRGPYVSVFGALAFYLILLRGKNRIRLFLSISLFCAIIFPFMDLGQFEIFGQMIENTDVVTDESTALHFLAAQGAWDQFLEDPFFGRYIIELNTQYYPHNIYLEALMSVGFIGALPFYWHLCLSMRAAVGLVRTDNQMTAVKVLCFLFFGHCIAGGISGSIWGVTGFWILSFVLIALWYRTPAHTIVQTLKDK